MRKKMSFKKDAAVFKRTAVKTKKVNIPGAIVPRGGIRL